MNRPHCVQVRLGMHVAIERRIDNDEVALAYAKAMCKRFPSMKVYDNDKPVLVATR